MRLAPTLQTERLTLRPLRAADFPAYGAFMGSDRARSMGGPFDEQAAWGMFCHDAGCWALFGHGALMLDLTDAGETVGQVCLSAGPLFPETELGWFVFEAHEGKGYASEAATAVLAWAFDSLPVDSIVSYTDVDNARSIAIAKRLGGTLDPDAPRPNPADLVYRHRRAA